LAAPCPTTLCVILYYRGVDSHTVSRWDEMSSNIVPAVRDETWRREANAWMQTHGFLDAGAKIWQLSSFSGLD
jgi:hypothetical protein